MPKEKSPEEQKYQLTVTETQARYIHMACELVTRLRMGQHSDITWKVFPDRIGKENFDRNKVEHLFDEAFKEIRQKPSHSSSDDERSEFSRVAWDLYQVIRYRLAWDQHPEGNPMHVHFDKPLPMSQHPLAQIQKVEQSPEITQAKKSKRGLK